MKKVGLLVAGTAMGVGALTALAPPAAADPVLIEVCLTVGPKSIDVTINDVTLLSLGPVGVDRFCIGI